MRKKVSLFLFVTWMIIIFLFSCESATNSTKTSKSFTKQVITVVEKVTKRKVGEIEKNKIIDKTFKVVRKSAHFFEYFVLAIFLIVVLKNYFEMNVKLVMVVCLLGLLYSITDEIHQLFVPGRTGRIVDILVDFLGVSLGSFSYYIICHKDRKRRKNKYSTIVSE